MTEASTGQPFSGRNAMLALFVVACFGGAAYMLWPDGADNVEASINTQTWISEDGKPFQHKLTAGEEEVKSPDGKRAFRAELCWWTKDGKVSPEPTAVLLQEVIGKPGPTFCPDCNRLVRGLNPAPVPFLPLEQQRVPPTRSEYESRASKYETQ